MSAIAFVGGVNDDASTVGAEARVCIAAPFACVLRRKVEMAERDSFAFCNVEEIDVLFSLFVGVGVV